MSWERFEGHKLKAGSTFVVTLNVDRKMRGAYLGFNQPIREQLLPGRRYCDLFFDRTRRRVGLRLLECPRDFNSYLIGIYRANGKPEAQARVYLVAFLKAWGLLAALKGRSYRAELKRDTDQDVWWFSVERILGFKN